MRICEVVLAPAVGGAESLVLDLAGELRARGHLVDATAIDPADPSAPSGIQSALLTTEHPRWARGKRLRRLATASRIVADERYDIVHAHSFLPNVYVRAAAALVARKRPIVTTLHSASDDFARLTPRAAERCLTPWTRAVVAVSPHLQQQYVEYFPHCAGRTVLIPNGVRKFPLAAPKTDGLPREFAVVGRLIPRKDLETVIRGFACFAAQAHRFDLNLHVIGPETDPVYANRLRQVAADADGKVNIIFRGAMHDPFEQIKIDVLLHGAVAEAHPVTILEAAARGIPIVCTLAPTVSGAIGDRCATFPAGDVPALCHRLEDLYRHWAHALELAAEAWSLVPDIRDCAASYEALFAELLS